MAYDATSGLWKPEDDSVSTKLNGLLSADSDYMKQAETAGMAAANKRGLQNSSIAVGASQAEKIKAALPIASQEASQTYGKNISAQGFEQSTKLQGQSITGQKELQTSELTSREQMQADAITSQERMQGRQLTAAEQQQARAEANQRYMQSRQIDSAEKLAADEISAKERMLNRQLSAEEQNQIRAITSNEFQQGRQIASTEGLSAAQIQAQKDLQAAQITSTESIAQWNISSHDRAAAMQATIAMSGQYTAMFAAILENPNIPADVRATYLEHAKNLSTQNLNLVKQLYEDVGIQW